MVEMLRLRAVRVGDKDIKVLRSLLGLASDASGPRWLVDTDDAQADALLVDVDDDEGRALWPELCSEYGAAVALTRQRDFPAKLRLDKPLRSQQVLRMLDRLGDPESVNDESGQWPVMQFGGEEDPLPLGEHLRRHSWDQPIRIEIDDAPPLLVDPGAGVWYFDGSDREMSRLLAANLCRTDAQPVSSHELVEQAGEMEQHNLASLKWRAGLALSEGALHPDLTGSVSFMLTQVPLQALSDTAFSRQARVLVKQPRSLDELVDASGAGRSDVAQFLNACHTCGFLLLDRRNGDRRAG